MGLYASVCTGIFKMTTKVYYDNYSDVLVVQGSGNVWPSRGLIYTIEDEKVIISLSANELRISKIAWQKIAREDGSLFSSPAEIMLYLDAEFTKFRAAGTEINDNAAALNTTYSSQKIEDRLDEEIGEEDLNYTLIFENQLSRGS